MQITNWETSDHFLSVHRFLSFFCVRCFVVNDLTHSPWVIKRSWYDPCFGVDRWVGYAAQYDCWCGMYGASFFSSCFSLDPCWSPWTHLGRIRNQIAPCTCKLGNQIDSPLGLHPACCLLVLLGPEANTTTRSNCCNDCGDVYFMVLGGCSQF